MYAGVSPLDLALRLGGGMFSPASLFAAGEQGGWYDPSDLSSIKGLFTSNDAEGQV